jgi:prepilin-type processing-associated H-X9-DG protein
MEFIGRGSPAAHFQKLSNEMYLKVWICPTDAIKKPATNYADFDDSNVSYFLSMDAAPTNTQPQSIFLAGDRHLEFSGRPVRPGLFTLTANMPVSWTRELHRDTAHSPGGVVLFVDGHTEFLGHERVVTALQSQSLATNRLAMP